MVDMHEQEQQQLIDQDMSKPDDSNDHHYIPREKFAPYDNGDGAKPKSTGNQPSDACYVRLNNLQTSPSKK